MIALILAAGFGSRLGSILGGNPKPMLRIGNRPLLGINLDKLIKLGIKRIYVNAHFEYQVIDEFIKNSDIYSNRVEIIYEEKLLGTAGTIKQIIDKYQPSELLVMHGDNYFEDDLKNMFEAFLTREKNFIGTIGTFITSQPENCGILLISQERIEKIIEKSSDNYGNIANSAIYFFDKNALEKIKLLNDSQNDLSIDFIPSIVQELKPIALEGVFIDIGTPENLNKARLHAESN
jgi:NDP-sugar pyrophosphorylase family protein